MSLTHQLAGAAYLNSRGLEERREQGQVYTPEHLVDFVLSEGGYRRGAGIGGATLLDPACGAGAFLCGAAKILCHHLQDSGLDPTSKRGSATYRDVVQRLIFGIDVDPHACSLARISLRGIVESLTGHQVDANFGSNNILCADFLRPESWELIRRPAGSQTFDFIVGNPPYVAATRLAAAEKARLREQFVTASGRVDLYTVFIECSLGLLSQGGRLAMITPDKFLSSETARALRSFIVAHAAVRTIAHFTSHRVFPDAATVPCVSVLERGRPQETVTLLECRANADAVHIESRSQLSPSELTPRSWHLRRPLLRALADRIKKAHGSLGAHVDRISAGPATGRDSIFVFPALEAPKVEPELLRSAVRGRDLKAFRIEDPGLKVLVPYHLENAQPTLVRLTDFPSARRYLEEHREELEKRHCVREWGKDWYDLHDQVLFDLAATKKILVPDVADSSRFVVDGGRYLPLHSVYYLIPKNPDDAHFLTAVLNSSVCEFIVRLTSPIMKDGFSRYRRQFLLALPIPNCTAATKRRISLASEEGDESKSEALVSSLFGLSTSEQRQVSKFLVERN